ncbi:hypothetical protein F6R97_30460 [Pseudomonas sp. JV414]|nr:hypothetical protein [Pseudomonas sp. JV414]
MKSCLSETRLSISSPFNVGAGLLAKAVCQPPKMYRMYRPLREQARSHIGLAALKLNCSPVYQSHGNSSPDSEE